jgi:hypothetical protein
MPWTYRQIDGLLLDPEGNLGGSGYSGAREGKNNPALQGIHNVGPIPRGDYVLGKPQTTITHGPFVLPLLAMATNNMFGRYGFLIHGDSVIEPGTASEGCIILPRDVRENIWNSPDHLLTVISGPVPSANKV